MSSQRSTEAPRGHRGYVRRKNVGRAAIAARRASQMAAKLGYRVAHVEEGRLAMDTLSLDRLGDEIAELSVHLDAATARLLDLIREFDTREGWNTGFRSCAAWLSWRVGLDLGAARERVRVAHALETLPLMGQALARGELSYAKVRALTRVATSETEARLLAVGRGGTAAQVERIVRGWRRLDRQAEAKESARRHASRALHVYEDEDGTVVVRGRLAPEVGALLLQALAAARETLYQQRRREETATSATDASADTPTRAQQQADALALLAETALHHELDPGGVAAGAAPPGPGLPLPGLRAPGGRGASHPTLGPRRPDHPLQSGPALSLAPPRGPRGALSGRTRARRHAPVPAAGRPPAARRPAAGRGAR